MARSKIWIPWLTVCFLLFSFFSPTFGSPALLFANRKDIRLIDATKPRGNITFVATSLEDATALDFYYANQTVFWADIGLEMIKMTYLNVTPMVEINVITTGLSSPEGLACDWLTKKIYWNDADTNRIEVSNFDGTHRKILFWEKLDQPRAIALSPMDGLMFWTDWGEVPKIERAAMNGNHSSRVVIVKDKLSWPNGITVDYQARRIYWADGKLKIISSIDYYGSNRKLVAEAELEHPFSLTVYKNVIYWTDFQTRSIHMCNQSACSGKVLLSGPVQLTPVGIHVYEAERQPKRETPCDRKNGGCSHLCLLSPEKPGYSCACPTGVKLKNKTTCNNGAQEILLLARRTDLRQISLDTPDYTDLVLQVEGVKHAIAIDYDPIEGYVYWSDDEVRKIRRAFLDGSGQEDIVVSEVYHPDGVVVDWIARNLYWTDTGTDRIEVARLNGTYRKVLINQGLDEPRAIALHPVMGYMFWTDWGKYPKIERAALDGANRTVIVDTELGWPNGLSLDYKTNKVYWGDAKMDKIEMVNMDGSDRRQLVTEQIPHIFGFSLLGDYVYWTDWQRRSIERVNKDMGTPREVIIEQLPDLMGLKAIKVKDSSGKNNCSLNNGGCSHLCLNRPDQYVCSCPMGMELAGNQKTCIVPEAFLLFARRVDIRRISLQTDHNNVVIPVSGIKDVTALDFDINDNRIYWTDVGQKTICRAFMNGSNLEYLVDFGLELPQGLAVDWIAHNIYWADRGSNRIEVARLDGSSRKVLVWENPGSPHTLALDPSQGYMYWSDWGKNPHIERAALDGSERYVLIKDAGKATGLTIDYDEYRIFWVNGDSNKIESSDLQGKRGVHVIVDSLLKPYGLTQYQDFIYWTDRSANSIERANKTSGDNRTRIEGQVPDVMDILVFHASRQSGWNPCAINNGDCSHLCLAEPRNSNNSPVNHSCACPTHFQLAADNKTCDAPESFMLISQRNQINRFVFDAQEVPDMILPIHQLKNVRSIDYDFLEKYIYWIDGKSGTIKRAYENGSSVSAVVATQNVFMPHDIAVDVYSRHIYWSCEKYNVINVTRMDATPVGMVVGERISGQEERPRALVLHPEKGLMFWVNLVKTPSIERAAMDGLKRVQLFYTDLGHPNALALDVRNDILYWSDSDLKQIERGDISGGNRRILVSLTPQQPISFAVFGDLLYWVSKDNTIHRINKQTGGYSAPVTHRLGQITDIIAVDKALQQTSSAHLCSKNNGGCSHLCFVELDSGESAALVARCSCPMGLKLNEDERTCGDPPTCSPEQFTCEKSTVECIPKVWRCDGIPECDDKSDEMNCPNCGKNQFRCRNGDCIDRDYLCDKKTHCSDGSDEEHCCRRDEFMCVSNHECVKANLVCNGVRDCPDNSDEAQTACPENHDSIIGNGEPKKTSYTIGILVSISVIILILIIIFLCRRRALPYVDGEECSDMMLVSKPPAVPSCSSTAGPRKGSLLRGTGDGTLVANGKCVPSTVTNGNTASSFGPPYNRSHVTGASSSSSTVTQYPQETLNPPPSPVTDKSQYSAYCCSSNLPVGRHYRTRYRPPPPTPCSTDECDDSEPYPCRLQCYTSYPEYGYESDPSVPGNHGRTDKYCESCPPSPSTERSFCNPYPPPPSPVGSTWFHH